MAVRIFPSALSPATSSRCNKLYRYPSLVILGRLPEKILNKGTIKKSIQRFISLSFLICAKLKNLGEIFGFLFLGPARTGDCLLIVPLPRQRCWPSIFSGQLRLIEIIL